MGKKIYGILPSDQKYWSFVKKNIRYRLREASFQRINVEYIYDSSDFDNIKDCLNNLVSIKHGEELSKKVLLPNIKTGILLSYIKNNMYEGLQPKEFFAIDSVFSADRNNILQSLAFGFEIIGERDPVLDSQVIYRAYSILKDCGLKEYTTLRINNLGGESSRRKINSILHDYYYDKLRTLPNECHKLFEEEKYLELLAYPDEDNKILAKLAPSLNEVISNSDKEYLETLKAYLEEMGILYVADNSYVNPKIDYTGPMFAFVDTNSGDVLIDGGNHDVFVERLGGRSSTTSGAEGNMNIIIEKMKEYKVDVPFKDKVQVYIAQLGPKAKKRSLSLIRDLREVGIHTMCSIGKSGITAQFEVAQKFDAQYCLLLGEREVFDEMVIVKDLAKGRQERIPYDDVINVMIDKIGKENIIHFRDLEE